MTIEEILNSDMTAEQKIAALSEKTVNVLFGAAEKGLKWSITRSFIPSWIDRNTPTS